MESSKYGWFWECPNGGKKCHYRHALPPGTAPSQGSLCEKKLDCLNEIFNNSSSFTGFVLKKDQKKEDKASAITIEELIEKEVMILFDGFILKYFSQTFYDIFIF